ncbi:MAG: RNA polymerase sigma factor [candidate division WOR-3 bacterium]
MYGEQEEADLDGELVQRSQNGDEEAFSQLVERYRSRVASIAYQVLGNYEDARDVAQEVFIKLYRGIGTFDPQKKFFTWLYRLTVNAAIDYLRVKKRRAMEGSLEDLPEGYPDFAGPEGELASHQLENKELRQIFVDLAQRLNPKQRAAFVLVDLQGFTPDEVSEILQCPKVTLRWYLHEGRKKIRIMLAREHPEYWRKGRRKEL